MLAANALDVLRFWSGLTVEMYSIGRGPPNLFHLGIANDDDESNDNEWNRNNEYEWDDI